MGKRKKICPCCGRRLWLREFYTPLSSYCKECEKEKKRAAYQGKPKGTFVNVNDGRLYTHCGYSTRLHWSRDMLDYLARHYGTSRNADIAGELGVSPRTMIRKARELGLKKSSGWLRKVWEDNRFLANSQARRLGYPGAIQKGEHRSPATEFKRKDNISIHH